MSVSGGSDDGVIYSDPEDQVEYNNLFSDGEAQEDPGNEDGDEQNKDDPSKKKKKAKSDKPKKTGPVIKRVLTEDDLCGKNGLIKLEDLCQDFKFEGKGHEKRDLDRLMHTIEHWAHILYPKLPFVQVLERIEFLGVRKKPVKVCVKKIRMGLMTKDDIFSEDVPQANQEDDEDVENNADAARLEHHNMRPSSNIWNQYEDEFPDDEDDLLAALDTVESQINIGDKPEKLDNNGDNDKEEETLSLKKSNIIVSSDDDDDDLLLAKIPSKTHETHDDILLSDKSDMEDNVVNSSLQNSKKRQIESSDDDDDDVLLSSNFKSKKDIQKQQRNSPPVLHPLSESSSDDDDDRLVIAEDPKPTSRNNVLSSDSESSRVNKPSKLNFKARKTPKSAKRRRVQKFLDDSDDDDLIIDEEKIPKSTSDADLLSDTEVSINTSKLKRRRVDCSEDEDDATTNVVSADTSQRRRLLISSDDDD